MTAQSGREAATLAHAGLNEARAQRVREEVANRYAEAGSYFGQCFVVPPVRFDLRGGTAGMHCVLRGTSWIRFNPWLFVRYWDDSLGNTVPHEVAHGVVWQRFPRRRVRPHGAQWREVMALFGADDRVTCDYDLADIPRRAQQRFPYTCACREHALSAVRHFRVQRGTSRYCCRYCSQPLSPQSGLLG